MQTLFQRYQTYVVDIDMLYKMGSEGPLAPWPKGGTQIEKIRLHGSNQKLLLQKKQLLRCALQWELLGLQKNIGTRAHKNIATYSLREKTPMGVFMDLRGKNMYIFLTKILFLYLPRMQNPFFSAPKNPQKNGHVWTCVFDDIRSFLEIEYFFQFFENYPGVQCSIFFHKKKDFFWNLLYLSAFAFPIEKKD